MSLSGSLQVGRTGLLVHQAAIQATGNNMANLATEGYHRQRVELLPVQSQQIQQGIFLGKGVRIEDVTRLIDESLETRLRKSMSDESRSTMTSELLTRIEAIENEFSDVDLSTHLGNFFDSFSELANNPQDMSLRTLATQQSDSLGRFIRDMRQEFAALREQTRLQLGDEVKAANDLLNKIETLNQRIAEQSAGGTGAAGLRDQRDLALGELSEYMSITTVENQTGVVDVFVGSLPVILNGQSRGLQVATRQGDGQLQFDVVIGADQSRLDLRSGSLSALSTFKDDHLQTAIDTLDTLASQLIWQVNRVHSQGQGLEGFSQVTSATRVADTTAVLSDAEAAGFAIPPQHGSFEIAVLQKSTGQRTTHVVSVDLDGINPAGDTTLQSLVADIDGIDHLEASVQTDGTIRIQVQASDFEFSFGRDTSGVLAAVGLNTLFTGGDARDIDINALVMNQPGMLAAATENLAGDNRNALAINALRDRGVKELNGLSLTQHWDRHVEDLAIRMGQARTEADADLVVKNSLIAQQQELSGVSADEEAVELLRFQRAYQASARFLTVVDEMIQMLMGVV